MGSRLFFSNVVLLLNALACAEASLARELT